MEIQEDWKKFLKLVGESPKEKLSKGKKDVSKLVPVQKVITRGGKAMTTTVYINPAEATQKTRNSKKYEGNDGVVGKKVDAVDVQSHLKPIRKNLGVEKYKEYLKSNGVKWEENKENTGADTMRASMAAKKWLEAGNKLDQDLYRSMLKGEPAKKEEPKKPAPKKEEPKLVVTEPKKPAKKKEMGVGDTVTFEDHTGVRTATIVEGVNARGYFKVKFSSGGTVFKKPDELKLEGAKEPEAKKEEPRQKSKNELSPEIKKGIKKILKEWADDSASNYSENMRRVSSEIGISKADKTNTFKVIAEVSYPHDKKEQKESVKRDIARQFDKSLDAELKESMKATYDYTQEKLKEAGTKSVVLYRGFNSDEGDRIHDELKKNGKSEMLSFALESWTTDVEQASFFGNHIIKMEIPAEEIFAIHEKGGTTDFGVEEYDGQKEHVLAPKVNSFTLELGKNVFNIEDDDFDYSKPERAKGGSRVK